MKLPCDEYHKPSLVISPPLFRWWLGTFKQQAITWANVDTDLWHHMASQGHGDLSIKYFHVETNTLQEYHWENFNIFLPSKWITCSPSWRFLSKHHDCHDHRNCFSHLDRAADMFRLLLPDIALSTNMSPMCFEKGKHIANKTRRLPF